MVKGSRRRTVYMGVALSSSGLLAHSWQGRRGRQSVFQLTCLRLQRPGIQPGPRPVLGRYNAPASAPPAPPLLCSILFSRFTPVGYGLSAMPEIELFAQRPVSVPYPDPPAYPHAKTQRARRRTELNSRGWSWRSWRETRTRPHAKTQGAQRTSPCPRR